jgi:hypothetical protein
MFLTGVVWWASKQPKGACLSVSLSNTYSMAQMESHVQVLFSILLLCKEAATGYIFRELTAEQVLQTKGRPL